MKTNLPMQRRVSAILAFVAAQAALSAEVSTPAAPAGESAELEQVVVTGTRIRGVAPTGSTLVSIDATDLVKMPASNIVDLLQREPAFAGIGNNEGVKRSVGSGVRGVNSSRGSDINLRGIGPRATLVLFGGMRTPPSGATGRNLDSSTMPSLALERVEIVADGASAIYGSDAIAGVVNFIPRKTYDGAETRVRFGRADGYDSQQVGQLFGQEWDGGGYVLSFEYSHHNSLVGTERDWFKADLTSQGGRDYRETQCNPGNILVGTTYYAIPVGGVTAANRASLVANTRNRCDINALADILPDQKIYTGYANVSQKLGDSIELYARGAYSQRDYKVRETLVGSQQLLYTLTVPSTNPYFVAPPGTNPTSVRVEYFMGDDNGLFDSGGLSRWMQFQTGAEMELAGDWVTSLDYSWARSDSNLLTYGVLTPALNTAVASSNPATAFNPFGGGNSESVVNDIFRNYYDPYGHAITQDVQLQANGSIFELPGGPVRIAVGTSYYELEFYAANHLGDARLLAQNKVSKYSKRDIVSGYGELFVPIVGSGNAVTGIQALDLSAAVRYDRYSDVGGTTNPKIGINWTPLDGLTLKGSYGTSFKAPFINDTSSPAVGASLVYSTVTDPQSATGTSGGISISDGNPDLTPEEATTYSFSAVVKPPALPGLEFTASWFSIDYRDSIDGIDAATALANPLLAPFVIRNPTAQQIADLEARTGLPYRGAQPTAIRWIVDTRNQNLGGLKMQGIDFSALYDWSTAIGELNAGVSGSYVTKYDVQVTPGAVVSDELNKVYTPLRLRMRGSLGWRREQLSTEAFLNYTNGYTNNQITPTESIDSYLTLDLRAAYAFESGSRWLDDSSISLEVINVLDEDPPYVNINGGADLSVASSLGRLVSLSISKRW